MIYTSYYGNTTLPSDFIRVQISNTKPNGYKVNFVWDTVFPDWTLINQIKEGLIDEHEYTRRYKSSLEYNKNYILSEFEGLIKQGDNVVLLCYESPSKFCHRHLLAEFLSEITNLEIKEL